MPEPLKIFTDYQQAYAYGQTNKCITLVLFDKKLWKIFPAGRASLFGELWTFDPEPTPTKP